MYDDHVLFRDHDATSLARERSAQIIAEIDRLPDEKLLANRPAELADAILQRHGLHCPKLLEDKVTKAARSANVEVRDEFNPYGGARTMPGMEVVITIPFTGERSLFDYRPSQWTSTLPRASVGASALEVRVSGTSVAPEQVQSKLSSTVFEISKYLGWLETDVAAANASLRATAFQRLEQRREKALQVKRLADSFGK